MRFRAATIWLFAAVATVSFGCASNDDDTADETIEKGTDDGDGTDTTDGGDGGTASSKPVGVAVSDYFSCALSSNGTVKCWGAISSPPTVSPTAIDGVSDAVEIATTDSHACVRNSDGTVKCWEASTSGNVFDVFGITDATRIKCGESYKCCAYLSDGTVKCWGIGPDAVAYLMFEDYDKVIFDFGPHNNDDICAVAALFSLNEIDALCEGIEYPHESTNWIDLAAAYGMYQVTVMIQYSDGLIRGFGKETSGDRDSGDWPLPGNAEISMFKSCTTKDSIFGLRDGSITQLSVSVYRREAYAATLSNDVGDGDVVDFSCTKSSEGNWCYVTTSGDVFCSGNNDYGQLGNGTTTSSDDFVQVVF